jgi:hypothetical protein
VPPVAQLASQEGTADGHRQTRRACAGERNIPLAIETYNFEQREAAERDNAAARVRFDLNKPYDAGWRWREFA